MIHSKDSFTESFSSLQLPELINSQTIRHSAHDSALRFTFTHWGTVRSGTIVHNQRRSSTCTKSLHGESVLWRWIISSVLSEWETLSAQDLNENHVLTVLWVSRSSSTPWSAELNWTEKGTNQFMKWSRSLGSFVCLNDTFATDTTLTLTDTVRETLSWTQSDRRLEGRRQTTWRETASATARDANMEVKIILQRRR